MKNRDLADDYLERAENRLAALEVYMERKGYADVVREAQEVVELALKALLRRSRVEVPRLHDVSDILKEKKHLLPEEIRPQVKELARISKKMRRDRELAFYGTEDLTPSEFYEEGDAKLAFKEATLVVQVCRQAFSLKLRAQ